MSAGSASRSSARRRRSRPRTGRPDVEGEPARAVAPAPGLLGGGEQVPDVVEEARVGGGVGPGRPSDGALVDVDHLVLGPPCLRCGRTFRVDLHAHELRPQLFEEDLIDQELLPLPDTPVTTVKVPRGNSTSIWRRLFSAAPMTFKHLPFPGRRVSGTGILFLPDRYWPVRLAGVGHDLLRRAGGHHLAAVDAGAGADVDEVVGGPHGVLVVLHHQQGVAQVPEVLQGRPAACRCPADGGRWRARPRI